MTATFSHILASLAAVVTGIITAMGYPGLVLLTTIGSACIPLPSELILPFAGYLVSIGTFSLAGVTVAAVTGENIGAAIAYEAGKRGGHALVDRFGRYVLIDTGHLAQAERFFARFGPLAVMLGRMLPVIRAFVAFPAGIARMDRVKFHIFTTLGSIPWCLGLAWLGLKLGRAWNTDPRIARAFHGLDVAIVAIVAAAIAWFIWHKLRAARR